MLQICESMETQAQILNVPHAVEKTAEQMSFRRNTVASSMSFKQKNHCVKYCTCILRQRRG